MLVHESAGDEESVPVQRFASLLHEGFEACGIQLDQEITPRNSQWRGTMTEWCQRLETIPEAGRFSEVIEILRLADQTQLGGDVDTGSRFRQVSLAALAGSPLAMNNLVSRVVALSNGIGMMGGLRFEKSGPFRGQFSLLENALQPLSASVSALAMLKQLDSAATPQRVRDLLWRRDLNVDMAERLLQAWHTFNELRLIREREVHPQWRNAAPLHLDIDDMNIAEQEHLREALEAVGTIQRHVGLNFSGIGE
jgi:signal-transduction protein with cAMP-binding, CBS, and nucleotidyltransferase domain